MKKKTNFSELKKAEIENRRNLIMETAQRIFTDKTFDKVNMREIAKEVGLSAGSIYTYFESQEALFLEISLRGADKLIRMFAEMDKNDKDCVKEAALAYIEFISKNFEYLQMVQHSMLFGKFKSTESLERAIQTYRKLFTELDTILRTAVPEDRLRLYSHLFFAALNGILFSYNRFPERSSQETLAHMRELAMLLADLFTNELPRRSNLAPTTKKRK